MGFTDIAKQLGVTARQVHAWHARRAGNGFPEAEGKAKSRAGGRPGPAFDLDQVLAWHKTYTPWGGKRRGQQ